MTEPHAAPTTNPEAVPADETMSVAHDAVIREALTVIDGALTQMLQRELVSSGEVADLLLDVRSLLATTTS